MKVQYTDTETKESLVLENVETYQLNNEHLMIEENKKKYNDFCTGRIIEREILKDNE